MNKCINIIYIMFFMVSCNVTNPGTKELPGDENKDPLRVPFVEYHGPEFWKNDPDILQDADLDYSSSIMKPLMYAFLVPSTEANKVMSNSNDYGFNWFNRWTDVFAQSSASESTLGRINQIIFPLKKTYSDSSFKFEDRIFIVFKDILSPLRHYLSKNDIPLLNESFNSTNFIPIDFKFWIGNGVYTLSDQWSYRDYVNSRHNEFIAPLINPNLRLEVGDSFHILFVAVLFNRDDNRLSYFRPINLNSLTDITYEVSP